MESIIQVFLGEDPKKRGKKLAQTGLPSLRSVTPDRLLRQQDGYLLLFFLKTLAGDGENGF